MSKYVRDALVGRVLDDARTALSAARLQGAGVYRLGANAQRRQGEGDKEC